MVKTEKKSTQDIINKHFPLIVSKMVEDPELFENKDLAMDEIQAYLRKRLNNESRWKRILRIPSQHIMGVITAVAGIGSIVYGLSVAVTITPEIILAGVTVGLGALLLWAAYTVGIEIPKDIRIDIDNAKIKMEDRINQWRKRQTK